ncbi:MAG: site-specific integrase [Acidobacteria bacterium]|nr:site-specific integrase [Acidobacteriota bacterium]
MISEQREGERVRRYVYGKTRAEVVTKLKAAPAVKAVAAGAITVKEYVEEWLAISLPLQVRASTVDNYGNVLRRHLLPTFGEGSLCEVGPTNLQKLYAEKRREGLSPRSVALLHSVVRRMLGDALREGHVSENVARKVRQPRVPRRHGRTLTPEQARLLLTAAHEHPLEGLVILGLCGGLRPGEAYALRWTDIYFDTSTVFVRHSLTALGKGRYEVGETKTAGSVRSVVLPESWCRRLAALPQSGEHVVSTSTGTRYDPNNGRRQFKALTKAAGVGEWHPHELRHSAASLLLSEGVPLKVVSEMLGHSSVAITGDVYAHVLPAARSAAATALEGLLAPMDALPQVPDPQGEGEDLAEADE